MNKSWLKNLLFAIGIFIIFFIIRIPTYYNGEPDTSDIYYHQYAIKLKGVIINEKKIDDRHCCYKLKVLFSNTKSHDLRGNGGKYFLYIKNDIAFFMSSYLNLNDTLLIDYSTKHMDVIRGAHDKKRYHSLPGFGLGYWNLVKESEVYME